MKSKTKKDFNVRQITIYGLFIALVYVATRFINIPGPTAGGLFHLGNVVSFTIAIVFGKRAGAIAGGIGMALFDLTSPYAAWAPFTFIIRVTMGYIIGYTSNLGKDEKDKNLFNILIGIVMASAVMIVGYYFTEVILYGNWLSPIESIWGNLMQCIIGTAISIPISISLKLGFKSRKMNTQI